MAQPTATTRHPREPWSGRTDSWDDFSLMRGGPLHRLSWALGLPPTRAGFVCFGIGIGLLTWVPLVALTAGAGTLMSGSTVPFLQSLGTHVRLLLALPLLFVAEEIFDHRARTGIQAIVHSELLPAEELPGLRHALIRGIRWRDAWIIEAVLALLTIALTVEGIRVDLPGELTTWRDAPDGQRTLAAWWYGIVSLPVFQFLLWRWVARLLIWGLLLWRICRLDLQLIPTHPDLSGGLGPLADAHVSLGPLSFALSSILVATFAEQVMYGQRDVRDAVLPLAVIVVGSTCALVAPLLLFTPNLLETKHRGVRDYGVLAASYTRAFDAKWVRRGPPEDEPLMGSADIQSLADLANSFDVVHHMRMIPIAPNQVLLLADWRRPRR